MEPDEDKVNLAYKKIQKNLTQAVPFIRGKLTKRLGFKFAPEIRFIRDEFNLALSEFQENYKSLADGQRIDKIYDPKLNENLYVDEKTRLTKELAEQTKKFQENYLKKINSIENEKEREEVIYISL